MSDTIHEWLLYKSLIAQDEWNPAEQIELLEEIDNKKFLWKKMGLKSYSPVPTQEEENAFLEQERKMKNEKA